MNGTVFAESWIDQLEHWMGQRGLRGFDRFDVRAHPLIRPAQPYPLPRKITTALTDLFRTLSRRMLGIAPQESAKAFALVPLGHLRRYETTKREVHLDRARSHLQWLLDHASEGYAGICWGYPFDVSGKGRSTPRNTPVVVVSAIAGEAFSLAWRITGGRNVCDYSAIYREVHGSGYPSAGMDGRNLLFRVYSRRPPAGAQHQSPR